MRAILVVLLSTLLLSGCVSDESKGLCPSAAILVPTSALTVFRENGPQDPSGELYSVWMTNANTSCDFDKKQHSTLSEVRLMLAAKRAPTGEDASYRVPYFVTVTHGGNRILTKKLYFANVHFPAGESVVNFEETVAGVDIKFDRNAKVGEYQILAGFQLTHSQLEYNTQNNKYAP
ncbi:MAG: hypothetical protein WDM89_14170 [Rhizomicrobium sp.]